MTADMNNDANQTPQTLRELAAAKDLDLTQLDSTQRHILNLDPLENLHKIEVKTWSDVETFLAKVGEVGLGMYQLSIKNAPDEIKDFVRSLRDCEDTSAMARTVNKRLKEESIINESIKLGADARSLSVQVMHLHDASGADSMRTQKFGVDLWDTMASVEQAHKENMSVAFVVNHGEQLKAATGILMSVAKELQRRGQISEEELDKTINIWVKEEKGDAKGHFHARSISPSDLLAASDADQRDAAEGRFKQLLEAKIEEEKKAESTRFETNQAALMKMKQGVEEKIEKDRQALSEQVEQLQAKLKNPGSDYADELRQLDEKISADAEAHKGEQDQAGRSMDEIMKAARSSVQTSGELGEIAELASTDIFTKGDDDTVNFKIG